MYLTTDGVLYLIGRMFFLSGTFNNGASNNQWCFRLDSGGNSTGLL